MKERQKGMRKIKGKEEKRYNLYDHPESRKHHNSIMKHEATTKFLSKPHSQRINSTKEINEIQQLKQTFSSRKNNHGSKKQIKKNSNTFPIQYASIYDVAILTHQSKIGTLDYNKCKKIKTPEAESIFKIKKKQMSSSRYSNNVIKVEIA